MGDLPTGTVTFLFTDIEGSTRLLRRLGDRYADVLAHHRRVLREAFDRHGGREVGTEGDSFFVAFVRAGDAVRAAVDGQRALASQAQPHRADLRVRMGLHTGEPSLAGDDYVGLGVHRAARISSIGHGGQVLLSQATSELVKDELPTDASLRDLGLQELKDFAEPERIHQLVVEGLASTFAPLKARAAEGPAPIVGRENELADLAHALNETLAGNGRAVLVGGEPGIGKSHLVGEVARRAAQAGARVLWGRCWEAGGAPAYWPWVQSLRAYARETPADAVRADLGDAAADVLQIVPELRELVPDAPTGGSIDAEGARFRLFDSTARFLRRSAARRPLCVVLEDLHAADTPSLLLLEFAVRELSDAPLLLLGTYRDTELDDRHPLVPLLAALARASSARTLLLHGVSRDETARLIEDTLGSRPRPETAAAIHRETEGNPLFVVEVARLVAADGSIDAVGDVGSRRTRLPATVREVIGQRLRRLSEPCAAVLVLASVLGREFALDALEALAGHPGEPVLDAIDEAVAARVVSEIPGAFARFRFAHTLIRETLYDGLSTTRRVRLHQQAGEALESLYAHDSKPHLAELAHHFLRAAPAGDAEKALRYATEAGDEAVALTAYEEAARLYRAALDVLTSGAAQDPDARCELLLRLGDAETRGGDTVAARATFLAAAAAARELERPELLARAALGYGGRFVWEAARGDPHLVPLLEEALEALGADGALRARVLARLAGGPLRDELERARRDRLSAEAVEIARGVGDPATLAYVLDGRHAAIWWPENLDERLEIATELVTVSARAGDRERELQGHHYRFIALLERGEVAATYEALEQQARIAEELRQPTHLFYVATCRATLAAFEGRFEEAERLTEEAFVLGERAERAMAAIYHGFQLYFIRRVSGRVGEIIEDLRRALTEFPTYTVTRCVLAHAYADLGREGDARSVFEPLAASSFGELPRNDEWIFGICVLADVAASLSDVPGATSLYELLRPYSGRNAVSAPDVCIGSVDRSLGVLAATLGEWDAAARHFAEAVRMNERAGGRPWLAQARFDLARSLLTSGRGEHEQASALLAGARETADELGMTALGHAARALSAEDRRG